MNTRQTDPDSNGFSILYVEDEPDSRETLGELITYRYPGARLLVSENGDEGLEFFRRYRPEIVITDINMPVVNGIRMAAEIKSICPATEIIALTACTSIEHLLQAIEIGISHYILKPLNIERIFQVIDKTLTIIRAGREVERQNRVIRGLNDELAFKAAELESANQELESFAYTVAHDLRSPIAVINGFSQVLLDVHGMRLDSECREHVQMINREILRMNRLIGALLHFSVHSRKPVIKAWTDLSVIANEIRDNLLLQDPARSVTFRIADGVNGFADPDLLRLVLENLLGNAWKYSSVKDDALIEFGLLNKEGQDVYFVRDNGIGFDQQDADKLFTAFQRLHGNDNIDGLGIGLATAFRIIKRHGGTIRAEAEKGRGATIYFTLQALLSEDDG